MDILAFSVPCNQAKKFAAVRLGRRYVLLPKDDFKSNPVHYKETDSDEFSPLFLFLVKRTVSRPDNPILPNDTWLKAKRGRSCSGLQIP